MKLKTVLVCLLIALLQCRTSVISGVIPQIKPNVILITADDLNLSIGSYSHPLVQTPNLDRLASEGVRFQKAYCQFPLCNPSRTSFLSGKRPESTGVTSNKLNPRRNLRDHPFLPEHFDSNEYFTARAGKVVHENFSNSVRWDLEFEIPADQETKVIRYPGLPPWESSDLDDSMLSDGRAARRIVELLREKRAEPFFLATGFHKPHSPFIAPKRYFQLYDLDEIELPPEDSDNDQTTRRQKKEVIRAYLACVSFMDAQIGLILDELDRLDLRRNTIIVFLSDHGLRLGEGGVFGKKRSLDEIVIRVPLILAGPGLQQNLVIDKPVELVDIYPTLVELCNLAEPSGMEGLSLVPIILDPNSPWKKAAFTEYTDKRSGFKKGRSVQTERYKYIRFAKGGELLFDIAADPNEKTNLAKMTQFRDQLTEMRRLLDQGWRSALP